MTTPERREALLSAAKQWRKHGSACAITEQRALYDRTAANLERQAETGAPTCVCCNKPIGQHAGIVR